MSNKPKISFGFNLSELSSPSPPEPAFSKEQERSNTGSFLKQESNGESIPQKKEKNQKNEFEVMRTPKFHSSHRKKEIKVVKAIGKSRFANQHQPKVLSPFSRLKSNSFVQMKD